MRYFYPRSPCGERPQSVTNERAYLLAISIHALLAESDRFSVSAHRLDGGFLSTLSLRRATAVPDLGKRDIRFLSTLSLRRATRSAGPWQAGYTISIHALLAESDNNVLPAYAACGISIHALLAESDNADYWTPVFTLNFYPRSPCGERPRDCPASSPRQYFYPRSPCGERH